MVAVYPVAYLAGRWIAADEATVPIGSLAIRYGLSVFEGIRLYSPLSSGPPRPFLLADHTRRLVNSMALVRLPDPGVRYLEGLIDELIARNQVNEDAYVRASVTPTNPGDLSDEAVPVLAITVTPMGRKKWLAEDAGMALAISDWQRAPARAFPPAAKNVSSYAGPRLAWLAARDAGFDGCVLTNRADRLCEAPTAALFLFRDGRLVTPALSEDVLPSITRAWVLRAAAELGIPAREAEITRDDAYQADEAFLCGTGIEIGPVRSFDGRAVSGWPTAPITRKLIASYFAAVRGGLAPSAVPAVADKTSML